MHDDRRLVEQRIRRELFDRVLPAMYSWFTPLRVDAWEAPGEPVPFAEAVAADYRPFTVGQHYGKPWGTTWFRLQGDVPAPLAGAGLEAVIDLGFHPDAAGFQCEGLVFADDGTPLQGVHPRRMGVSVAHLAPGPFTLWVEAASNPSFPQFGASPLGRLDTAGDRALYRLRRADLAVLDREVHGLLLDVEVLLGLLTALPTADPRRPRVLRTLEGAFDLLDVRAIGDTAPAVRAHLRPALDLPARASAHRVVGVGHAHIDSAWLWPLRETVRKCARTFASATRMMDEHPDYVFVCSQAAQYQWMEQRYPVIFERIRERAARGQWQPVGGMWVEPDMNLPSGESLVRQLVFGQRYFEQHFGRRCTEVWIPDVFGYPASLPQVFVAGGCHRFVTQKLSWNQQNRFPHNTFWWEGLDGTRVLTHFPPVDTYNAVVSTEEMVHAQGNFKDHDWSDWSLMPYGHGNGGGGPTREMLGRAERLADLDGAPTLQLGTTDAFFDRVDAEIAAGAPVPVWRGELYFEMHRGTLTSQVDTKLWNRRCERLLWEAELWTAATGTSAATRDVVDEAWREVLLRQFHDIIPGSSIGWVHDEAEATLAAVAARLEQVVSDAVAGFAGTEPRIVSSRRHAGTEVVDVDGSPVLAAVDPLAVLPVRPVAAAPVVTTEHSMSNEWLAVRWDLDGELVSVIDVAAGRELLAAPIEVRIAPDHPVHYDAWDLEAWTVQAGVPVGGVTAVRLVEQHPLRARLQVQRRVGATSTMTQTYTLCAGARRLDIAFDIDWHEDEHYLSLHVPLDVRADQALCDIQFGHVARPTHSSTSWDAAKFEVCAHRWVALDERGYGAAVLNDGRYGHGVQGGQADTAGTTVRVSLLRAAKYPDPQADLGRHHLTIAVMPFTDLSDVIAQAEALNVPLRVLPAAGVGAGDAPLPSGPRVDHPGVQLSAVKRADDGSGDWIVRLYEACGSRSAVTVQLPQRIRAAERTNLLEDAGEGLDVADGIVALTLRPFELVTLRLRT